MTAASELKSAAVVKRKTGKTPTNQTQAVSKTAVRNAVEVALEVEVREVREARSNKPGSTTASATQEVAVAQAVNVTSGSKAASDIRAASIRATRLPVSVFSQNSRFTPNTQQNPVPLWQILPEGLLRAGRAA